MAPAKPLKKAFPGPPPTEWDVRQFCLAAKDGLMSQVEDFFDKFGAGLLDLPDSSGDNALAWAAWSGETEVVKFLLDKGAEVDVKGQHGKTALVWAAHNGRNDIVSLLLKKGADPDVADNYGDTALSVAQRFGHREIETEVQGVLDRKRRIEAQARADEEGRKLASRRLDELKRVSKGPKIDKPPSPGT
jgi:hypothetical protein